MAVTYRYTQYDPRGSYYGYVSYNVSPGLDRWFTPGDTLTVTGKAFHRLSAHACIELGLTVAGRTFFARVNQSVPARRVATFTLSLAVTQEMADLIRDGREAEGTLSFTLWRGADAAGTADPMNPAEARTLRLLKYRIQPVIETARFARCRPAGEGWEAHDEGQYVLAEDLRLSLAEAATAVDVTIHRLEYADEDGAVHAVNLDPAALLAGVAETAPGLLAGHRFLLGRDYTLTITAGDAYDTVQVRVTVPRAFANFHQSGAARGGAAFGMFSGSTDSDPRLETAYPLHAYAGIYGADGVRVDGGAERQIDSFTEQFSAYNEAMRPRLQRVGRLVQLSGAATPRSSISGNDAEHVMFTIPAEFRPLQPVYATCRGSGDRTWQLTVTPAGEALMSKYAGGGSYQSAGQGAMLCLHALWLATDYTGPVTAWRPVRAMRSNSSDGYRATCSNSSSSNFLPWKAFDYRATTCWRARMEADGAWLQLQMDVALKNIAVELYARDTLYVENPTAGEVLGSSDGETWTQIGAYAGLSDTQSGGKLGTVVCGNATPYRYVRLTVTAHAGDGNYVALGYMVVRGELE